MSDVRVNNRPIFIESGQKTWGDVLVAVDARAAADGHVVTAARFGGVDQPSFRDPDLAATRVPDAGGIEVDTVARGPLLRSTLGTAGLSLRDLASGACQAAAQFRAGHTAEGHRQLTVLLDTLRTLVELTMATAAAAGTDLTTLDCGTGTAIAVLGDTGVVLDGLARHQEVEDWVALADDLETALAPSLLAWTAVFDALQERCAA